jgi:hypothetical protein
MRLRRASDDEQAGRVTVEPVHDARPLGLVPAFDVVGEQSVHERLSRVSRCWMHHEPGRLVYDEQMLVFVWNDKVHLLRLERARTRGGRLELELLPTLELVALRACAPVEEHAASAQQTFGHGTRTDLGKLRKEAVEPLPCGLRRDA